MKFKNITNVGFFNRTHTPLHLTQNISSNCRYHQPTFFSTLDLIKPITPKNHIQHILSSLSPQFNCTAETQPFDGVLLTGVQHMLSTTVEMFSELKKRGLKDAIVAGKSYSTHPRSIKEFQNLGYTFIRESEQLGYGRFNDSMRDATYRVWAKALQKIKRKKYKLLIALDDGADLLLTTHPKLFNGLPNKPDAFIGIEQTRGGSNRSSFTGLPFPIINVAGSAVKNIIEYPWVAEAIFQKVAMLVKKEIEPELSRKPIIGLIGNGSLGKTVVEKLVAADYRVIVYDKNQQRYFSNSDTLHYPEAGLLIMSADVVIGCTGEDITALKSTLHGFLYSMQKKWLVSTGSKDTEFNTLLEIIQNETKLPGQTPDPLKNIKYKNRAGTELIVVRGGFPINFTNEAHSVPPERIWPTRAALLLACFMSVNLYYTNNPVLRAANILQLDAKGQLAILRMYQKQNPEDPCLKPFHNLNDMEVLEYIKLNSEGEEVNSYSFFSNDNPSLANRC